MSYETLQISEIGCGSIGIFVERDRTWKPEVLVTSIHPIYPPLDLSFVRTKAGYRKVREDKYHSTELQSPVGVVVEDRKSL